MFQIDNCDLLMTIFGFMNTKTRVLAGDRTVTVAASSEWNKLPIYIRQPSLKEKLGLIFRSHILFNIYCLLQITKFQRFKGPLISKIN